MPPLDGSAETRATSYAAVEQERDLLDVPRSPFGVEANGEVTEPLPVYRADVPVAAVEDAPAAGPAWYELGGQMDQALAAKYCRPQPEATAADDYRRVWGNIRAGFSSLRRSGEHGAQRVAAVTRGIGSAALNVAMTPVRGVGDSIRWLNEDDADGFQTAREKKLGMGLIAGIVAVGLGAGVTVGIASDKEGQSSATSPAASRLHNTAPSAGPSAPAAQSPSRVHAPSAPNGGTNRRNLSAVRALPGQTLYADMQAAGYSPASIMPTLYRAADASGLPHEWVNVGGNGNVALKVKGQWGAGYILRVLNISKPGRHAGNESTANTSYMPRHAKDLQAHEQRVAA